MSKKQQKVTMPNMQEISTLTEGESEGAQRILNFIEKAFIKNNEELKFAVQAASEIKQQLSAVEDKRKSLVSPLQGVIADINKLFKPISDTLKKSESLLKSKVSDFHFRQAEKRDELIEKAASQNNETKSQKLIKQADDCVIDKIDGLSLRDKFECKVEDQQTLMQFCIKEGLYNFLTLDVKMLEAHVKKIGKDPCFPGFSVKKTHTVAITTSKVKN